MNEAITDAAESLAEEEPRVPTRRLLVFEISGGVFASDMELFREIVPSQKTTRLPGAPDTVCGLINLRGTIVTVIDGGVALGKPACARTTGLILLVEYLDHLAGILVDDVRDIHDVPIDQFQTDSGVDGIRAAIVEIEGRSVGVLDIKALVMDVFGQRR
jgi:purine-binding chemotaxis protein CheW